MANEEKRVHRVADRTKPKLDEDKIAKEYERLTKLIIRDVHAFMRYYPVFRTRFKKEDIIRFLANPERHQRDLREAVRFIYYASPHFRRLILFFASLSDLVYYVSPYRINPNKVSVERVDQNLRKVLNTLSLMKIQSQFRKVLLVCMREDVFYGTFLVADDDIMIQQLPSNYCVIASVEGGVPNVTFDFRYFDRFPENLENYPDEFRIKYAKYRKAVEGVETEDKLRELRPWFIELDAPNSFAVKANNEYLRCAIPPFAGVLPEVYDIESYKELKMDATELENYAMLAMKIPLDEDGNWGIDLNKAEDFWRNLDSVLPDRVGSVLTPMDIEKISFDRSESADNDTITEAEQSLFTAAGVSSLLFNNPKASAGSLLLSIKADQAITYGVVKSIEDVINRFIHSKQYGKYFNVTFLDCSVYNREELGDAYLKAATYGLPTISMYAATQGLSQANIDSMSFLETTVLKLQDKFKQIQSSSNMSSDAINGEQAGAPQKSVGDLSDSGEQTREDSDDWG